MKSLPLYLSLLIPFSATAGDFEGCKGTEIKKVKGRAVDITKELESAQSRIKKLCEEGIPRQLKSISSLSSSCVRGKPIAGRFQDNLNVDLQGLTSSAKKACAALRDNLAHAKTNCATRSIKLSQLQLKIKELEVTSGAGGRISEGAQAESFRRLQSVYEDSARTFTEIAAISKEHSEKVYDKLPDRDEKRGEAGEKESADTKDPKLDQLVASMQRSFEVNSKDNPNALDCRKLAAKNGELKKFADTLKKNLWPNGKRIARSLVSQSNSDTQKAAEYTKLAVESKLRVASLAGEDLPRAEAIKTGAPATPANQGANSAASELSTFAGFLPTDSPVVEPNKVTAGQAGVKAALEAAGGPVPSNTPTAPIESYYGEGTPPPPAKQPPPKTVWNLWGLL
jgi:hypothetical protein